jgi:hypothetical protein
LRRGWHDVVIITPVVAVTKQSATFIDVMKYAYRA